jgi:integrase
MSDQDAIPTLLAFLFGEHAALARQGASARLLLWCTAFDDWLAERRRKYCRNACTSAANAWRQLLGRLRKAPWEITPADLKDHVCWLEGLGRAPDTIRGVLAGLSGFYAWCDSQRVDPLCAPGFNPAAAVPRPKAENYAKARALTPQEARRFLSLLQQDPYSLSRRDYAFFLARLHLGVPLHELMHLKWGQIRSDSAGAWVDWDSPRPAQLLPPAVWQAILDYLEASGRLLGISPTAFIFAPLVYGLVEGATGQAADWNEARCISNTQIERILKIYGRLAGIPEKKLTLVALRHTAALLRLEAGDSAEQIQAFLGRSTVQDTRKYLRRLPPLTPPSAAAQTAAEPSPSAAPQPAVEPPPAPVSIRPRQSRWASMTHGCLSKSQPPDELAAMLADQKTGLGEEIAGLRLVARRLRAMQAETASQRELEDLLGAYGRAASQIGTLVRHEKQLARRAKNPGWAQELLALVGQDAGQGRSNPEMQLDSQRLLEEIASLRLVLRRLFAMAQDNSQTVAGVLRLADLCGNACIRLARLLLLEGGQPGELEQELQQGISQALKEVAKELKLS